jgi:DNA-binding transcriptional LysR family regulator
MLKSTLTQWQIFNSVVENGGYLQAAEKLNRSHSSLHHAVGKLQTQLGTNLLSVTGKRVELTDFGEMMYRRSVQLIADAKELEDLAHYAKQGWETELTLAVESLYPKAMLTSILRRFGEEGRGTRLKLNSVILNGAIEAITEASADMVISPFAPKGHIGTVLTTVQLLPLAHKDHPLIRTSSPIETRELSRHLQIVISDGVEAFKHPDIGWLKSEQRWSVSDFHHARDILISGMGFSWLPPDMFREDIGNGTLRQINTRDSLERMVTLHLVIPRPDRLGPAGHLLAQFFRDC